MQVWYVGVGNRCLVIVVHILCESRAQRDFTIICCITSEMPLVLIYISLGACTPLPSVARCIQSYFVYKFTVFTSSLIFKTISSLTNVYVNFYVS